MRRAAMRLLLGLLIALPLAAAQAQAPAPGAAPPPPPASGTPAVPPPGPTAAPPPGGQMASPPGGQMSAPPPGGQMAPPPGGQMAPAPGAAPAAPAPGPTAAPPPGPAAQTAAPAPAPATGGIDVPAIAMFLAFVALSLVITGWAARRTRSATDFFAAGGRVTGFQNGIAIAGDFMSAASFLGISALVYASGFDGLLYSIGFLGGWPIIMFLMAERLRNLGKYSMADVASFRLDPVAVRSFAAVSSLVVIALYLIAQMVGAGQLVHLLFPVLEYWQAVVIVGVLMILYVTFGGMIATTWVQIIKAVLLLGGATYMAVAVLAHFGFDLNAMFKGAVAAHAKHAKILAPGLKYKEPLSTLSLMLGLLFGTAGLPHILMRFFTVPDAREARTSVFWATTFIGYFYILTFVIGFGAIVLVASNPAYVVAATHAVRGGANMVAVHMADAVGGPLIKGFISAVAFATILAVVSGLTLAGAAAVSHDLFVGVFMRGRATEGREVAVSRASTFVLGVIAILLGIAFEKQNVAYMVGLAFAVAASANFPLLILNMYWRGFNTAGALLGGWIGLISAVALTVLSPGIWVDVLKHTHAIFPLDSPALISMPLAFLGGWIGSLMGRNSERARLEEAAFDPMYVRSQTGAGAEGAATH